MSRSLLPPDPSGLGRNGAFAGGASGLEACTYALSRAFGADVACAVVAVDGDPARLLPEEQALVAAAVPSRRREFAAGRVSARALLLGLGFEAVPLLADAERAPRWPHGAIGSIAHDGHRCAVAVARTGRLGAIGLDIEPDEPLESELWKELFRPAELELLASQPRALRGRLARVLFSAKESVFKCTRALLGTTLAFREVEILMAQSTQCFRARLHHPSSLALAGIVPVGFHLACAGSILSGATVPPLPFGRRSARRAAERA